MSTQSTKAPAKASDNHADSNDSHGNSPAAWTAVVIMLVAFAVGTVGFCAALPIVVWIAAVVLVLGAVVGGVLKKMGYGVGGHRYVPKAHG